MSHLPIYRTSFSSTFEYFLMNLSKNFETNFLFRLAFFERNFTFLTRKQLISEATSHYTGQAVKQLYVLVLGLDVIGNPYGLVVGLTKGVEDLFYEPFQVLLPNIITCIVK